MAVNGKAARKPAQRKPSKAKAKAPRRKKADILATVLMEHSAKDLVRRATSVTFYDAQYKRIVSAKLSERLRVDVQN